MKKLIVMIVLSVVGGSVMAQTGLKQQQPNFVQPFSLKLDTNIKLPLLKDLTKMAQTNGLKNIYDLRNFNQPVLANVPFNKIEGYNMPIVVLEGKSNMPVKKIEGFYTMPVVGTNMLKQNRITKVTP